MKSPTTIARITGKTAHAETRAAVNPEVDETEVAKFFRIFGLIKFVFGSREM